MAPTTVQIHHTPTCGPNTMIAGGLTSRLTTKSDVVVRRSKGFSALAHQ